MRLGEKMETNNYRFDELLHLVADADQDRLSNIYIFHLLKACLAKAYLEVQELLSDVVRWKLTEEMLYTTLVRENIPVLTFLRKREHPVAVLDQNKSDIASKSNAAKGQVVFHNQKLLYAGNLCTLWQTISGQVYFCRRS